MKKSARKNSSSTKSHRQNQRRPVQKRKIIVYIAVSADGFIARRDGGIDWLERPRPKGNYGMPAFFKSIDTILWGRKTYSQALESKVDLSIFGRGINNYIFSRQLAAASQPATAGSPQKSAAPNVELVSEPIKLFAQRLRAQPGKNIMMMGGGEIIGAFLDEGELDEFRIHVIPVFIGEGIPLIAPRHRSVKLELLSTKKFPDGVVHLNYRVI